MGWGGTKKNRKQRIVLLACFFSQDGRKEGRWKNRLPGEDIPGLGQGIGLSLFGWWRTQNLI